MALLKGDADVFIDFIFYSESSLNEDNRPLAHT
jgi:hypothetical protein